MNILKAYIALGLLAILSGCATTPQIITYPVFHESIDIHVSKETVSTWTETPANDALMPDSQVFVAKKSGGFSLLGGAFGIAIQRSGAESQAADASNGLSLYFDELVKNKLSAMELNPKVNLVDIEESTSFKLLPSVRFEIDKKGQALLSVRLTSRYLIPDEKLVTKDYLLLVDESRPLEGNQGWFGTSKRFEKTVHLAFETLVQTFYEDVTRRLPAANDPTLKRATVQFEGYKNPLEAVVLNEGTKYTAIATLYRANPIRNAITIVPNSKLAY